MKTLKGSATLLLLVLGVTFLAAGCGKSTKVGVQDELSMKESEIAELREKIEAQEAATRAAEREASKAKDEARKAAQRAEAAANNASSNNSSSSSTSVAGGDMLPPNAKVGECFARVVIPAKFSTETARVLSTEASTKIEVIPAEYEWVDEKIVVKEASSRLEVVPATYDWVEEKILVSPARSYWKKGRGPIEKVDNSTGEIMCLIEEPAKYNTVRKKVEKTPATTRTIEIPAEYKTVRVQRQVRPAREVKKELPAQYKTVTKENMIAPSKMEWREILCETNTTGDVAMQIQRALKDKGFDPGPIDGIIGSQTRSAITAFQKKQNLPTGGLTIGTLKALNVRI